MFDWFEPVPEVRCPRCAARVDEWQGKDGPLGLLVWRQGHRHPIDQRVDDEIRWTDVELTRFELPATFGIYGSCENGHWVDGACSAGGGVWNSTQATVRDRQRDGRWTQPDRTNK